MPHWLNTIRRLSCPLKHRLKTLLLSGASSDAPLIDRCRARVHHVPGKTKASRAPILQWNCRSSRVLRIIPKMKALPSGCHAGCSTLVMKQPITAVRRVVVALEGSDDVTYVQDWLAAYPFRQPVELSIICVVPVPQPVDAVPIPAFDVWEKGTIEAAQHLVKDVAASLKGEHYVTMGRVLRGHPAETIAREAGPKDLIVVGSHARHGLQRFLLGSVSHAITHRAPCPVLVVRKRI